MKIPQYIKWTPVLFDGSTVYGVVSINPEWINNSYDEKYIIHYSNGAIGKTMSYSGIQSHEELSEITEEEYLTFLVMES